MIRLLALTLCLLFAMSTIAQQNFEHIYAQSPFSRINANMLIGQQMYLAGTESSCSTPVLRLTNGVQFDVEYRESQGREGFQEMLFLPDQDSTLIIGGHYLQFEGTSYHEGSRISGYTLNGDLLFERLIKVKANTFDFFNDPTFSFTLNGADEIVIAHPDTLHWISTQGNVLKNRAYPDLKLIDLKTFNETLMLGVTTTALVWLNNEGDIQKQHTIPTGQIKGLDLINDRMYVYTNREFMEVVDMITLLPGGNYANELNPEGLRGNHQSIFVWGKDTETAFTEFIQFEKATNAIVQKELFQQSGIEINDVFATEDQLFFSGNYRPLNDPLQQAFVKTIDILDIDNYQEDIALKNLSIISGLELSYDIGPDTVFTFRGRPLYFEFDLVNLGTDTLSSFSLFSNILGSLHCDVALIHRHFKDLAIPPGEQLTITDSAYYYFSSLQNTPQLQLKVYAPNNHFDGNSSNNEEFTDLILSTENSILPPTAIRLYPNPANEELQIELPDQVYTEALQLAIFDVQGKIVENRVLNYWSENEALKINTAHIPNGIYFLRLQVADNMISKKLVINH